MRIIVIVAALLALSACSDDSCVHADAAADVSEDVVLALHETCTSDPQCISSFCASAVCLDDQGDEDGDGLINRMERQLGTDVFLKDTDGDGKEDFEEVGPDYNRPLDTDDDGVIDALESSILDSEAPGNDAQPRQRLAYLDARRQLREIPRHRLLDDIVHRLRQRQLDDVFTQCLE